MSVPELLSDPIQQLRQWYDEAQRSQPGADVVALATATREGIPSVRMVNFKGWHGERLSFFSNYESRKGRELKSNPRASMLFYWASLKRQVIAEGRCEVMSSADSALYFAVRHREVQLTTHMSQQSRELPSFEWMEQRVDALRREFIDREIPCPSYWGGYLLHPERLEFRIAREQRRHQRWEFVRSERNWSQRKLYP
jgi:pyridoxamine 5'-phosphate oxidase